MSNDRQWRCRLEEFLSDRVDESVFEPSHSLPPAGTICRDKMDYLVQSTPVVAHSNFVRMEIFLSIQGESTCGEKKENGHGKSNGNWKLKKNSHQMRRVSQVVAMKVMMRLVLLAMLLLVSEAECLP